MAVKEIWAKNEAMKQKLLIAMTLNHALKEKDGKFAGDPTELAMLEYAQKNNRISNGDAKLTYSIPFDSDRKAMSTIHQYENEEWLITKGATESIESMLANDNDKEYRKGNRKNVGRRHKGDCICRKKNFRQIKKYYTRRNRNRFNFYWISRVD